MIFIKTSKVDAGKEMVVLIHNYPNELTQDILSTGQIVDFIPEPIEIEGKQSTLYFNPNNKDFFYEYKDIPKTEEELAKEEMQAMKEAIDFLLMGGM